MKNVHLENLRKKIGLTQTELADKIGMAQSSYSHIEIGRSKPNLETLTKLADFYKVPIDAIVGRNFLNIDFGKFSDLHFELVSRISDLNEAECQKLLGYLDGWNK